MRKAIYVRHRSIQQRSAATLKNMNWEENLVDSPSGIRELILQTKRIAVLGIKTEAQADQPAFYVAKYLASVGFELVPVPVYYPEVTEILGEPVYRRLT